MMAPASSIAVFKKYFVDVGKLTPLKLGLLFISIDVVCPLSPPKFEKILKSKVPCKSQFLALNVLILLVDAEIAVKAPLGLLTEYITPPLKISFTPINSPDQVVVDEGFHDLEGKNFSILELTKMYLEKSNHDDEKSAKIYNAIEKLLNRVSTKTEEEEENEDQEN